MDFKYSKLSLYNRDELLHKLNIDKKYSDKALLLKAYDMWGKSMLDEINGDFAFALYDDEKRELFSARDPLGIKALYYTAVDGQYFFSDNMDELFLLSGIEKKPNLESMNTLINQGAVDYEETMYCNVKRIPPGHYLTITHNTKTLDRYWYPEKIKIDYSISLNDAAVKFSHLFETAIISRIGSDDETAYELSGGLDSSSVVSLVKYKYPSKSIDTYSMCFNNLKCDEYQYIKSIEGKYHFHTKKINLDKIDYKKKYNFDFSYRLNPHWSITTTFTMYFPLMEKMRKDKKKIIITGQGGDHLLTGNCYALSDLMRRFEFGKIAKELIHIRHSPLYYSLDCIILMLITEKQKKFFKRLLSPFLKKNSIPKGGPIRDLFQLRKMTSAAQRSDIDLLISAAESTMLDGNIFHSAEKAYNVEFRHPFFDKKLIEFVLTLPPEYKYSRCWIKVVLRYTMKDILPEKIRSRSDKAEFSELIVQQLDAIDVKGIMKNSNLVSLDLIKQEKIDTLINSFENNDYSELLFLWKIINLEYWYQSAFPHKTIDK